jgi:hypothetical protein
LSNERDRTVKGVMQATMRNAVGAALCMAAVFFAFYGVVGSSAAEAQRSATVRVPFQHGITVGEWGKTAYQPAPTKAVLQGLRALYHVDTVTLFVVWTQENAVSTEIRPGDQTAPTENVVEAIRSARAAGLRVILRPYVDRDDGGWRGYLQPSSLDRWFASYERFILTFAALAQREKVSGFVVGSEMASLSAQAPHWRSLVQKVRGQFKGFLTYQANWDEAERVTWWDRLDVISISAYYPLTQNANYSTSDLVRGWRHYLKPGLGVVNWFDRIENLSLRYRRPLMFGEIGYRTVAGTATKPWEVGPLGPSRTQDQTRAYSAALRVWYRVPWFRGFQWWYVSPQASLLDGRMGADHRPAASTLGVLSRWYRKRRTVSKPPAARRDRRRRHRLRRERTGLPERKARS